METVKLALSAMNTRFELVLQGDPVASLRAAGEEALREITRLEELLSAFKPTSEIAHLNARAGIESTQVSPEVFGLLQQARLLWEQSEGALDITVGPLMRCWGFWRAAGHLPEDADIESARASVGFQHIELDAGKRTVRFLRPGMTVDLGAIGKGYAIEQAVEWLRESGVRSALLHGGTSTTRAIGRPLDQSEWRAGIEIPQGLGSGSSGVWTTVDLCDNAIAVSSLSEKSFATNGRTYGHVMDPRTGRPVERAVLSAVVVPNATLADAWSTALMVLGRPGLEVLCVSQPGVRGLVVEPNGSVAAVGFALPPAAGLK